MPDVRAALQAVFRQVFDDPNLEVRDDMDASSVEGWDSLPAHQPDRRRREGLRG